MDYRAIFGTNRPRRRRPRVTRTGEPVNLLQLMRRRVRYRPYAFNRLRNRSREMNLTNFDGNFSQNFTFLPDSQSINRSSSLCANVERKDVSTNTDYPCCSGASSSDRRPELPVVAERPSLTIKAPNLITCNSSLGHVEDKERQQSSVKSIVLAAETQNDIERSTAVDSNTDREEQTVSTEELPIKSNSNIVSEVKSVELSLTHLQSSSNSVVTDTTDVSSNTIDNSSHNSALVVEPNTSGESLMPTPPTIAYIDAHHSSSQEQISTSDSSFNNVIRSLPLIRHDDAVANVVADAEAGGDGHHNDSVLQFEITLTTAIAGNEDDIENDEEDDPNDDDDDNEIDNNENDDNDHNENVDNDNEEVDEEEQGDGD